MPDRARERNAKRRLVFAMLSVLMLAATVLTPLRGNISTALAVNTITVDKHDPQCSDQSGQPFCSISAAIASVTTGSGGNIAVRAGVYEENLIIPAGLTIDGDDDGGTVVDGGGAGSVIVVDSRVRVTLSDLTLTNGADTDGGGLHARGPVILTDIDVTGNTATNRGGGIYVAGTSLTMVGGSVSGNTASTGGGIMSDGSAPAVELSTTAIRGNQAGEGGGVYAGGDEGSLTIEASAVADNHATSGSGGGVFSTGSSNVVNVTIGGNSASTGGGWFQSTGFASTNNVTITDNDATEYGGGISVDSGDLVVANTIIAANTAPVAPDCVGDLGAVTSGGHNILGVGDDCPAISDGSAGDQVGSRSNPLDARLSLPTTTDGPHTLAYAPLIDSPAIDAADGATCEPNDQRGTLRPIGASCDVGAIEGAASLQAAIDAADPGDVLEIPSGTYRESIVITKDLTLAGEDAATTIIDAEGLARTVDVSGSVEVGISEFTITGGATPRSGGGIRSRNADLTLDGVVLHANEAGLFGGGVYQQGGSLTVTGSEIHHNVALNGGGVFSLAVAEIRLTLIQSNSAHRGGGIFAESRSATSPATSLLVEQSSVSGNRADSNGGGLLNRTATDIVQSTFAGNGAGASGGGVRNETTGDLTMTNSTLSGNTAGTAGGGLANVAQVALHQSTLTDNEAPAGSGITNEATGTIAGTIVAGNGDADCSGAGISSGGHNLIGVTGCLVEADVTDLVGTPESPIDPLLAPLGDYGGPTLTHALLKGSLAVDGGPTEAQSDTAPFGCPAVDQRSVERPNGAACDIGSVESSGGSITIKVTTDVKTTGPGATEVAIDDIPLDAIADVAATPVASIPVASIPVASIPVASIPVASIPVASIPVASIPVASIPVASIPADLVDQCGDQPDWEALLAGTDLEGRPLQTVTLQDVFELDPLPPCVEGLTMSNIDLSGTPLGQMSLTALSFGSVGIDELPLDPDTAQPQSQVWCEFLAESGFDCAENGVTGTTTVAELEFLGADVASTPVASIPVASIPVASIPVASIPVASIPVASIHRLFDCTQLDCDDVPDDFTFQQAFEDGLILPDATYKDVLFAILTSVNFPWEELPLDQLGVQRFDPNAPSIRYSVTMTPTNIGSLPATVNVDLPDGFFYREGTSRLTEIVGETETDTSLADPIIDGTEHTWSGVGPLVDGVTAYRLDFDVFPGLSLGTHRTDANVTASDVIASVIGRAPVTVEEAFEPEGDNPNTAPVIGGDSLIISHVGEAHNVDFYQVPIPTIPGAQIRVTLSQLGADNDLIVYRPFAPELSQYDERPAGIPSEPVEDQGINGINQQDDLTPETIQDIPVASIPVASISASRSTADEQVEVIATPSEATPDDPEVPNTYTIQVSGYNGATTAQPYVLRAQVVDSAGYVVCSPPSFPFADPGAPSQLLDLTTLPSDLDTVFLVNSRRTEMRHGSTEAADMLADLQALVALLNDDSPSPADPELAALGLKAAVIDVEGVLGHGAVSAAYAAWDLNPCNPESANGVATAITGILADIDAALGANGPVEFVTVLGPDEAIPMARVPDLTTLSNEADYAGAFGTDTALFGALAASQVLSDDVYADIDPVPWLGRVLYIPDRAVGRVLETPDEIRAHFALFIENDGQLATDSALVSAYDFLIDGGQDVATALTASLGVAPDTTLISDTWDRTDLIDTLLPPEPADIVDVVGLNAHFDHYRAEPAAGNDLFTVNDLIANGSDTNDESRLKRRLFFSMGCHSGLPVQDDFFDTDDIRSKDWAQVFSQHGAIWVGNTGYGYGDTSTVALSEHLMTLFAERLDGSMKAGQALAFAKQAYTAGLGLYGVFDEKVLTEATFYGLPFFGLGGAEALPPASVPPDETVESEQVPDTGQPDAEKTVIDPITGLDSRRLDLTDITFDTISTVNGTYLQVSQYVIADADSGDPPQLVEPPPRTQSTHYRPIQPKIEIVATDPAAPAHGVILTELSSFDSPDTDGLDPAVARPVIDLTNNEPELVFSNTIFPSILQAVNTYRSPSGPEQQLVLIPGQFFTDPNSGNARQRAFTDISAQLFYSTSDDFDPPLIIESDALLRGNEITFEVEITEDGDDLDDGSDEVIRALVLYKDESGLWTRIELTDEGEDRFTGSNGGVVGTDIDFFIQAVDKSGNVAVSTNKSTFFTARLLEVTVEPAVASEGDSVELTASFTAPSEGPFTFTVDWGDNTSPTVAPFVADPFVTGHVFSDNGDYTIEACVSDGATFEECATVGVMISNVAPTVEAGPDQILDSVLDAVSIEATFTDPGNDDHTATIDWGDDVVTPGIVAGESVFGSHTYATDGVYKVTVEVFDGDDTGSDTLTVIAGNRPPVVVVPAKDTTVDEGQIARARGRFSDPDGDAIVNITANRGNISILASGDWLWSELTTDGPDVFTVTVTAEDARGAKGQDSFVVTVNDVPPEVEIFAEAEVDESRTFGLGVSPPSDPGADQVSHFVVEWGDSKSDTFTEVVSGPSVSHVYENGPAVHEVVVSVVDEDGTHVVGTHEVTVLNVAPDVSIEGAPEASVEPHTAVTLVGVVVDPGDPSPRYDWSVRKASALVGGGSAPTLTLTLAEPGSYDVALIVTDSDGATSAPATTTLTVAASEESPVVDAYSLRRVIRIGRDVTLTASFSGHVTTASIDWGDGTIDGITPISGSLLASHRYTESGSFRPTLILTGSDAASATIGLRTVTAVEKRPKNRDLSAR